VQLDAAGAATASNLTRTYPMSGGWWKNAVQLSAMRASLRRAAPGTISGSDLAEATKGLICSLHESRWREANWVRTSHPLSDERLGADLAGRARLLAERLAACRRTSDGHAMGCLVVLTGPETQIAHEIASGLAHHLDLPLVLIDSDEALEGKRDEGDGGRVGRKSFLARNAVAADQAVSYLAPAADDLGKWEGVLARIPLTRHLLVLHAPGPGLPEAIRSAAATILPWAHLTPEARRSQWGRLPVGGEAPAVATVAELRVAAARVALGDLASSGERTVLP
jgi:hypothetical protein